MAEHNLTPPTDLTPGQRAIWDQTLHQLDLAHTRHRVDPNSLAAYTTAVTHWRQAHTLVNQTNVLIVRDGDKITPNPALTVMARTADTITRFANRYGLNWRDPAPPMPPAETPPAHVSECGKCGAVHDPQRCDGHRRADGTQCRKVKGYRTDHLHSGNCTYHGGASPSGKAHAARQQVERLYFGLAARGEVEPMSDPFAAIAAMAGERRAWADAAFDQLNREGALAVADDRGVERLRPVAALAERMADRAFRAAKDMADLDIDQRLVAVQREAWMAALDYVQSAVDRALVRLGLDPLDPHVAEVVELELRRPA